MPAGIGMDDGRNGRWLRSALVALDAAAVVAGWTAAAIAPWTPNASGGAYLVGALAAAGAGLVALAAGRLYQSRVSSVRAVELAFLPKAAVAATGGGLAAHAAMDDGGLSPWWALTTALCVFVALVASRSAFDAYLRDCRRRGRHVRRLVVVGADDEASELAGLVGDHP